MRLATTLLGIGLGALAATAALNASFAGETEDAVFDSPEVQELATRAEALKVDDQIALVQRIRRSLEGKLLTPSADAWKGFEDLRSRSDAGLARILDRGPFEGLVSPRGGGAYWSFSKRSNSYDQWPQIELQKWSFSTGFYGSNSGIVVRLDARTLAGVSESGLDADLLATAEDVCTKARSGRRDRPKAETGGIYAVRAVMWDECDVLAAFQVVDMDTRGVSIAWRVIRTFDVPKRKR
jgi:hypothetical protein